MRHQKLHLVRQDAAVAQDEVFPQTGHIGRVEQRHVGLLGGAVALAVVAGAAGGDHVHPGVDTVLGKRDDVLARQVFLMEMVAAVGADVAVAGEKLAVGQARLEVEGVDVGHAAGADDAVDGDDGLLAGGGIVAAAEHGDLPTRLPAHFVRRVVDDRLLQRDPRLGQALGRELQDLQNTPPSTTKCQKRKSNVYPAQYTLFL